MTINTPKNILTCYQDFVTESWKIEGLKLKRIPLQNIVDYHISFINNDEISVKSLSHAALKFTNGYGKLRDKPGMNVRVGGHVPIAGGSDIVKLLEKMCGIAQGTNAFDLHRNFEDIHPFMDGNGRVGRMLWAWSMRHDPIALERGFLHSWYYQSLSASRQNNDNAEVVDLADATIDMNGSRV